MKSMHCFPLYFTIICFVNIADAFHSRSFKLQSLIPSISLPKLFLSTLPSEIIYPEVIVHSRESSYPIFIESNIWSNQHLNQLVDILKARKVLIVSNNVVAPLYLDSISVPLIRSGIVIETVILQDGELFKTMDSVLQILNKAIDSELDRHCVFIALGGGVVGDICGFAASIFQRGVRCLQIPTTLLAMVDSAVGGKTGVNHSLGKNLIGTFHQPMAVLADITTLQTLPQREFVSALAEVIKYGLVHDATFFHFIKDNISKILSRSVHDSSIMVEVVKRCCEAKATMVAQDEYEQNDIRALLNLGHTFGHAIETATEYDGSWLHGEAIAVGILMATEMSRRLGFIDISTALRITQLIHQCGLPTKPPAGLTSDTFLTLMRRDKKVVDNRMRLVLLKGELGSAVITSDYDIQVLKDTLNHFTT